MSSCSTQSALFESELPHLKLLHRGKVRDVYEADADHLLIVTTDRLSAFDVILPNPIPGKGQVLTEVANLMNTPLQAACGLGRLEANDCGSGLRS